MPSQLVTAENNANLGALAELRRGAGRDLDNFVYVHAHLGLGAALVLGGGLHRGVSGQAGEISHLRVREFGPLCPCGAHGCLEPLTNARAAGALLQPLHGRIASDRLLTLARDDDPAAARVLGETGRLIGRSLGSLYTILDPAAVIVGGALAEASPHLLDGLETSLRHHAHPTIAQHLRVIPAQLGEHAEVIGAAELLTMRHPFRRADQA